MPRGIKRDFLFKMPGTPKKIAGLITHYFGGNRTPKLGNTDFKTTIKQGLRGKVIESRSAVRGQNSVRRRLFVSWRISAGQQNICLVLLSNADNLS